MTGRLAFSGCPLRGLSATAHGGPPPPNRPNRPPWAVACEIRDAEDREHAQKAIERFKKDYEAKFSKGGRKGHLGRRAGPRLFDFPAEH